MAATRATTASIVGAPESSHAYSSWRARARALVSGRCTEPLERVGGLERRLHRLGALTHPGQRLNLRVGRQDTEADRNTMREGDVAQTACRLTRDVLEMRRLAPDHAPQRHDRVEALAGRRGLGDHRELERAGHPRHFYIAVRDPAAAQRVPGPVEQLGGHVFMKAADDDRHAPLAAGGARSGRCFVWHDQWVRKWPSLSRFTSR